MYSSPFSQEKWWNWITARSVYKKYHQFHISSSLRSWGSDRFLHPSSLPHWNYLHLLNKDKIYTWSTHSQLYLKFLLYASINTLESYNKHYFEPVKKIWQHLPVGSSINSCMASLFPAWLPPLMTLNAGTGRMTSLLPARSAMCL